MLERNDGGETKGSSSVELHTHKRHKRKNKQQRNDDEDVHSGTYQTQFIVFDWFGGGLLGVYEN